MCFCLQMRCMVQPSNVCFWLWMDCQNFHDITPTSHETDKSFRIEEEKEDEVNEKGNLCSRKVTFGASTACIQTQIASELFKRKSGMHFNILSIVNLIELESIIFGRSLVQPFHPKIKTKSLSPRIFYVCVAF